MGAESGRRPIAIEEEASRRRKTSADVSDRRVRFHWTDRDSRVRTAADTSTVARTDGEVAAASPNGGDARA
jgi:hypothetical protein